MKFTHLNSNIHDAPRPFKIKYTCSKYLFFFFLFLRNLFFFGDMRIINIWFYMNCVSCKIEYYFFYFQFYMNPQSYMFDFTGLQCHVKLNIHEIHIIFDFTWHYSHVKSNIHGCNNHVILNIHDYLDHVNSILYDGTYHIDLKLKRHVT